MIVHDVDQNSIEWAKLHLGIPTASSLDQLLTPEFELRKGETPRTLVYKKVAEAWRGKPMIDLGASSFAMEQGMLLESEAIPFWELTTGRKVTRVGFITTDDGRFGCSPDGLLGDYDGKGNYSGIEIKCPAPHTHVKYLSEGVIPKEYRAQVFGGMFATGFQKWIFMSYCRGFPPLILEAHFDMKIMEQIKRAIFDFHAALDKAKATIERYQLNPLNEFK